MRRTPSQTGFGVVMAGIIMVSLLAACTAGPPAWVKDGGRAWSESGGEKTMLYGASGVTIGGTHKADIYSPEVSEIADRRARAEQAKALETLVESWAKDFVEAHGAIRGGSSMEATQTITRALIERVHVVMRGSQIEKRWQDPKSGVVWSLASLPLDEVKNQLLLVIPPEDRGKMQARADELFEKLLKKSEPGHTPNGTGSTKE